MDKEKVKAFLTDLGKLTAKHGIEIDGCWCCGSPQLKEVNANGNVYATDDKFEYLHFCPVEKTGDCYSTVVGEFESESK